ncbi:MAG TPA: hypothetical protein VMV47_12275 [Bacteroidales bacterium]|nr:hypothetical protein [Bacteroidales bacterium]
MNLKKLSHNADIFIPVMTHKNHADTFVKVCITLRAYFFELQQGLGSLHFFASAETAQQAFGAVVHGFASDFFAHEAVFSAHEAAAGHLLQSIDISVVAFFASLGSPGEAFATNIAINATKIIPDKPIIIFFISQQFFSLNKDKYNKK